MKNIKFSVKRITVNYEVFDYYLEVDDSFLDLTVDGIPTESQNRFLLDKIHNGPSMLATQVIFDELNWEGVTQISLVED